MTSYTIDAYAWIEYFEGSEAGRRVKDIIERDKNDILTCAVTFSEVVSKFIRTGKDPEIAIKAIHILSKIFEVDEELGIYAGKLHGDLRKKIEGFGLADAFVLATARKFNSKILTGDKHFKNFKEVIMIVSIVL